MVWKAGQLTALLGNEDGVMFSGRGISAHRSLFSPAALHHHQQPAMKEAFYAVQQGRRPGIYKQWSEAEKLITGFKGAVFKKFADLKNANEFLQQVGYGNVATITPVTSKYFNKLTSQTRHLSTTAHTGTRSSHTFKRSLKVSYYAVAMGKKPGIYRSWAECNNQVLGFQGAVYKKFDDVAGAQRYIDSYNKGEDLLTVPGSRKKKKTYYAVNFGRGDGDIFETWEECQDAIRNKKGVSYKKYDDFASAKDFISLEPEVQLSLEAKHFAINAFLQNNSKAVLRMQQEMEPTYVYMDGSFIVRGEQPPVAGYGVYFGEEDPRNISEALVLPDIDSFVAEVHATRAALLQIHYEITRYDNGEGDLCPKFLLATDSETVIKLLTDYTRTWKDSDYDKRSAGVALKEVVQLYNDIREFYMSNTAIFADHKFEVKWVKGHAGIEGNEMADQLAKLGALSTGASE